MKHSSLTLQITKLSCGSCVARAEKALREVVGVQDAAVNLAAESATLAYDSPATPATIANALAGAGYPAAVDQITLDQLIGKPPGDQFKLMVVIFARVDAQPAF